MRMVLLGIGFAAAVLAIFIIRMWNSRAGRQGRGEVSVVAQIKGTGHMQDGRPAAEFVGLDQAVYRFTVPEAVAHELQPGQQGVLTFQGNQFIYFVRKETLKPQQQAGVRVS